MEWTDDGSTVSATFTKGGGDFNDAMVIYLSTGSSGRNVIGTDVNDRGDLLRSSISYIEAAASKSLTFPTGFEATHAIAIDTTFGGLWSIPSTTTVGDNDLSFVSSVDSTLTTNTQSSFTYNFDVADLGLTPNSGATIDFVATYLNPFGGTDSNGFVSNEGYGGTFPGGNIGQEDFSFSSAESYTTIPEPGAALLFLSGLGLIHFLRKRS